MTVRAPRPAEHEQWLRLRCALWPDCPADVHRHEMQHLQQDPQRGQVLVHENAAGSLDGFVEVSIRSDAEGCRSGRVGYIEGLYVTPGARRAGVSSALLAGAEQWARAKGCSEMASDTEIENAVSQRAHSRAGYHEVNRLVHLRKSLRGSGEHGR